MVKKGTHSPLPIGIPSLFLYVNMRHIKSYIYDHTVQITTPHLTSWSHRCAVHKQTVCPAVAEWWWIRFFTVNTLNFKVSAQVIWIQSRAEQSKAKYVMLLTSLSHCRPSQAAKPGCAGPDPENETEKGKELYQIDPHTQKTKLNQKQESSSNY